MNKRITGHLAALLTVCVWGTTFIVSKTLVQVFKPTEVILIRFVLALLVLEIIHPKILRNRSWREELPFIGAGLFGVTFYYLLENSALTYTLAENVGVIIATSPFLTAILYMIADRIRKKAGAEAGSRVRPVFFAGFVVSLAGIVLISLNGKQFHMNPFGDLLTFGAALSWAAYNLVLRSISAKGNDELENTKRIFFWGLVFLIPAVLLTGFSPDLQLLTEPRTILKLLYLAAMASAACYILWNYAVKTLGAVKTSIYIYLNPVVSVIASVIILSEPLTGKVILGTVFVLGGLFLSGL